MLASDEDAASAASIDAVAFRALHGTLARFYRVMVIDTGNNMRASNWQAAIEAADQVVIVSTVREDTAQSAAWAVDALRATGHEDVVRKAVTVLSDPAPRRDPALADRLHDHFGRLTRAVLDVPYDRSLVGGAPLEWTRWTPDPGGVAARHGRGGGRPVAQVFAVMGKMGPWRPPRPPGPPSSRVPAGVSAPRSPRARRPGVPARAARPDRGAPAATAQRIAAAHPDAEVHVVAVDLVDPGAVRSAAAAPRRLWAPWTCWCTTPG